MTDPYELLPALYRVRDETGALRALTAVLAARAAAIDADVRQLYDDWFVETCDERILPLIGDLLGVRPLESIGDGSATTRAYVANTVAFRRRKGTAAVLEQLAADVTGWPARVVEFYPRLATTEHLNHLRPGVPALVSLRDATGLELTGGPFDRTAHTAQVGRRYNSRSIGVFLWRLPVFTVRQGTARPAAKTPDGRYHVHPAAIDVPLFNPRRAETDIAQLAEEIDLPGPLRRRPLAAELAARRAGTVTGDDGWFGSAAVLRVHANTGGGFDEIPAAELAVCDLSTWRRPAAPGVRAAVDPVLGRIAFPDGVLPTRVEIDHTYAFGARLGGGPYDRGDPDEGLRQATFVRGVSRHRTGTGIVTTLRGAVTAWNNEPPGAVGVIAVLDSTTYAQDVTVDVPAGSTLFVVAARLPDDAKMQAGNLILDDVRPHLSTIMTVRGTAGVDGAPAGRCVLDGLLVTGTVTVHRLSALRVSHCTLLPGGPLSVQPPPAGEQFTVTVDRCVTGPVAVTGDGVLRIADSIVDGSVDCGDGDVDIVAATVFGEARARRLEVSDSLLLGPVTAARQQDGCIRFSYVAPGSRTPRRHRCLEAPPPAFVSRRYGDPGYGRLAHDGGPVATGPVATGPVATGPFATGASDGAEMGAFHYLRQPQRLRNLRTSLDGYLPAGYTAGVFPVT